MEGGLNIGYTNKDEWLMYTVDVTDAGYYAIDFFISVNSDNSKCYVEVDGIPSASCDLENNKSWSEWRYYCEKNNVSPPVFYMAEGRHQVKFYFETGGYNINGLKFMWHDTP